MSQYLSKSPKYLVLALLLYFPLFSHLGTLPIRLWDESRLAVNALEMYENGDFIVTHYDGKPEMWNTKPPLLIWMQVAFMHILEPGELAVRLPSALAGLLTCIGLFLFFKRYFKNFWFGFIVAIVLVTSNGYVEYHATRSGDYDALLTLFTTMGAFSFFTYVETKKLKYLYWYFILTSLGVLTKSVTGLMFLPAIAIYAVWSKQLVPLLRNKHFYFGFGGFILLVLSYYLIRESVNPGYISAVHENELGGRYLDVIEGHKQEFLFYFKNFIDYKLTAWHLLIPCGLVAGLAIQDKKLKKVTFFSALMSITFFIVISTAQTKCNWYDVPLYPFIAVLISVFIFIIFKLIKELSFVKKQSLTTVAPLIFLFLLCISPYRAMLNKTFAPVERRDQKSYYAISHYLQDAVDGKYNMENKSLVYDGYNAHVFFYVELLNTSGASVSFKDWTKLLVGDTVIASQINVSEYIAANYEYEKTVINDDLVEFEIKALKSEQSE